MNQEQTQRIELRLRIALALLTIFPLVSGIFGLAGINNPMYDSGLPFNLILDSNLRFLNGMSVGVAVSVYLILPRIRKESTAFRILMATFMCGAMGRTLSLLLIDEVPAMLVGVILIELISPAVLIYYQNKIKEQP